ncbi:MAG: YXWGXW repeat-containing protein [Rhodothermales bacterium]
MKSKAWTSIALFLFIALSATGCTAERVVIREPDPHTVIVTDQPGPDRIIVVHKKPPPLKREIKPRRPSSRHVWVGGYWSWRSSKYVWVSGRWVVRPRSGVRWVSGHWKKQRGGWVWVGGRWR